MNCYITRTGGFLPGEAVENKDIQKYIGSLLGESRVRKKILAANGIKKRYYAQDLKQNSTHNTYQLAVEAIKNCLGETSLANPISYLSAGSTNTPLIGPGLASILHSKLQKNGLINHSIEINSNSGICTSSAQALVNAIRTVHLGEHQSALAVGAEHPSEILKAKSINPPYDILTIIKDLRRSKWFMSVFLRFMLSDGAGAFLLENRPSESSTSFQVNWTFSRSYANEAPLCMKLQSNSLLLSQDVEILAKYLAPMSRKVVSEAMQTQSDSLDSYSVILPHISSLYFRRTTKNVLKDLTPGSREIPFWTNLATVGNTGSASIYLMLDEYRRTQTLSSGDKILLFIPESGQFNFVLISLTVVNP